MRGAVSVSGIAIFLLFFSVSAFGQGSWGSITEPVKVFGEGYIQVIGSSEEGQSRYAAIRAATVVAQRDLLEVVQGLNLHGTTTVQDGMLQSDTIRTSMQGFLKGAIKCGEKYDPNLRYAEVCLRLNIRGNGGLYDTILPLMKKENLLPPLASAYKPGFPSTPEVAKPLEITHPYDGLIIDVREHNFRPALINRILADNNEVIFDPSKIVSSILVERGCGGFTNDEAKAKALLQTWGANSPMHVKAKGVVKVTDVQVGPDEAAAIFTHNQKANFLAQAKVVFVLK